MTAERTSEAKRRAIERGVPPYPNVPPGYRRGEGRRLEVDPETADAVRTAFTMRAEGATIKDVRAYLRSAGIERSYHGVGALLASRVVLGELRFGDIVNEGSHPAIVDQVTWRRVQKIAVARGRKPQSDRLLARLGVLRCGSCGSRMVVGSTVQQGKRYALYRCPPTGDCKQRVTISAQLAEEVVAKETQAALGGLRGTASVASGIEEAVQERDRHQAALDAAIRAFSGLEDEASARERLAELREARNVAQDHVDELMATADTRSLTVTAGDWEFLTFDERRALIRAVVAEARVSSGRGRDRITIELRGE